VESEKIFNVVRGFAMTIEAESSRSYNWSRDVKLGLSIRNRVAASPIPKFWGPGVRLRSPSFLDCDRGLYQKLENFGLTEIHQRRVCKCMRVKRCQSRTVPFVEGHNQKRSVETVSKSCSTVNHVIFIQRRHSPPSHPWVQVILKQYEKGYSSLHLPMVSGLTYTSELGDVTR